MCVWLLAACLGVLPSTQIVNVGVPSPIITPTTTAATTTTTPGRPNPSMNPPTNPSQYPPSNPSNFPPTNPSMLPPTNPSMLPPTNPSILPPTNPSMMPTTNPSMFPPTNPSMFPPTNPSMYPPTNPSQSPPSGNLVSTASPQYPGTNVVAVPIICQSPFAVCVTNPNQVSVGVTGRPPAIDPRLGTTPAYSAPYVQGNLPQIMGYSGQLPNSNVNFPRNRRSVFIPKDKLTKNASFFNVFGTKEHSIMKRQTNCVCVTAGTCPRGTNYGAGLIDFRIVTPGGIGGGSCPVGQELCCNGGTQTSIACGVNQQTPATAVQPTSGQASFGEFPWQVLILTNQNDYIAGGVLVDQLNVLTVVHRLTPYLVSGTAPNVKVRLGEWDAAGTYEPVPYQEYSVRRVFTHPSFNSATLQYDIAVVRLSTAVPITPQQGAAVTINRACLPSSAALVYTGQRCWVSGWGKNAFGQAGVYQQILKKVDVPIVDPSTCQSSLQTARLGASYVLDTTSFICAGGEVNKDACTGDGGSGIVCQVNGQWTVVGLVSWGLGCAMTGVPGVYVNVAALLPWINQQIATN